MRICGKMKNSCNRLRLVKIERLYKIGFDICDFYNDMEK